MMFKIRRLIITISYLKFIQIYTRIYFKIRQIIRKFIGFKYPFSLETLHPNIKFLYTLTHSTSYENRKFIFLNTSVYFSEQIDWNYKKNGKLWTYNLSYFDFLHQENIDHKSAFDLMIDYVNNMQNIDDGLESFPISIRGINWIKYLSIHGVNNKLLNDSLYAQYYILLDNLEYHLLGNHLLENGFSLFFGSYYFKDEKLYKTAKKILVQELEEQILNDGGHFELSPMYHQIMLYRLFDCINLLQNNQWKEQELLDLFQNKATKMLGWLETMTFRNGTIPLFNDSANRIAPTTNQLKEYAERLNIVSEYVKLGASGYRKYDCENYECRMDVGHIGPDYIPGHVHSDMFNFELYVQGRPIIVDTGLSTYEANTRRKIERSTSSHNTVEVNGMDQTRVWSAFRVAERANIISLKEGDDYLESSHDGYKMLDAIHTRRFEFNEEWISIGDTITSETNYESVAYIHFHPDVEVSMKSDMVYANGMILIFEHSDSVTIDRYDYAPEFNKLIPANMLHIKFNNKLKMDIRL